MLAVFAGLVLMLAVVVGALITVNIAGSLVRLRHQRRGDPEGQDARGQQVEAHPTANGASASSVF